MIITLLLISTGSASLTTSNRSDNYYGPTYSIRHGLPTISVVTNENPLFYETAQLKNSDTMYSHTMGVDTGGGGGRARFSSSTLYLLGTIVDLYQMLAFIL